MAKQNVKISFMQKLPGWDRFLYNELFTPQQHCQNPKRQAKPPTCNFIKKRLQRRFFPVNIAEFLRTTALKNIYGRLLLNDHNDHDDDE